MTNDDTNPPHKSILREIMDLIKEHPQLGRWAKILGGGYLLIQILVLIFGLAILYTIYSSFQSNVSKFDERSAAFDKAFNEEWKRRQNNRREFNQNWDNRFDQMKKMAEESTKTYESLKISRKDIFSPDEADLNVHDHFEQENK